MMHCLSHTLCLSISKRIRYSLNLSPRVQMPYEFERTSDLEGIMGTKWPGKYILKGGKEGPGCSIVRN